jgi:anti-anti-sigma regulatory factor
MDIEVKGGAADTAPVIEAAAILFANGQFLQALAALTKAVDDGNLGLSALQAWLMLFDLHRSLNMKAEFEALGMEFLATFERSPPVWIEAEPQFNPALATGAIGYCALTGVLSDQSASQFEQLRRMSQQQQSIRIDFAKLQGVDPTGCARLLAALDVLKTSGKEVVFTGEVQLLRLLEAGCRAGNKDADGVLWSLLFEIMRRLGMKDRFEEAAVSYAVTYELSPPSWGTSTRAKPRTGPYVAAAEPAQPAFRLSGDVTGAIESLPNGLQDWAKSHSPVVIDMSAVRRVDFVSAGQLLNVFTKLQQAGSTIQIRGANEMVAALFDVMGIHQVASIIRNR